MFGFGRIRYNSATFATSDCFICSPDYLVSGLDRRQAINQAAEAVLFDIRRVRLELLIGFEFVEQIVKFINSVTNAFHRTDALGFGVGFGSLGQPTSIRSAVCFLDYPFTV